MDPERANAGETVIDFTSEASRTRMSLSEMSQWQKGDVVVAEEVALGRVDPSLHLARGRILTTGQ